MFNLLTSINIIMVTMMRFFSVSVGCMYNCMKRYILRTAITLMKHVLNTKNRAYNFLSQWKDHLISTQELHETTTKIYQYDGLHENMKWRLQQQLFPVKPGFYLLLKRVWERFLHLNVRQWEMLYVVVQEFFIVEKLFKLFFNIRHDKGVWPSWKWMATVML